MEWKISELTDTFSGKNKKNLSLLCLGKGSKKIKENSIQGPDGVFVTAASFLNITAITGTANLSEISYY